MFPCLPTFDDSAHIHEALDTSLYSLSCMTHPSGHGEVRTALPGLLGTLHLLRTMTWRSRTGKDSEFWIQVM